MVLATLWCISTNASFVTLKSVEENRSSKERGSRYVPCLQAGRNAGGIYVCGEPAYSAALPLNRDNPLNKKTIERK